MSKTTAMKPLALAMGAAFVTSLAGTSVANAAENPFSMTELPSGYMISDSDMKEGKCGASHMKEKEGKCGESMDKSKMKEEGKCGEGKGMDKSKMKKEGKCGEGKCGEGKMKKESMDKSKMKEEGKCGGKK